MRNKRVNQLVKKCLLLLSFLLFALHHAAWAAPAKMLPPLENRLHNSLSPYLALHGSDPVHWQEWNPDVQERAKLENKLLFISIGYFSCHWCHVMQAESYKNPETAELINQYFIPVKVDRELDVALDTEMIAYAQSVLGASGWPLNIIMTPDGYPLYAILYQPPGRFRQMLDVLGKEWLKDSNGLKQIARNSVRQEKNIQKIKIDAVLAASVRSRLLQQTLAQADMLAGGIEVARKFPLAPQLFALLELEAVKHDETLAAWLQLTLNHMMEGGLRDHLGGGFFRYTIDPGWQRPHFEKMLYDNAQLARVYLRASVVLNRPDYREIAFETLDFMQREMFRDGGMITSISALGLNGNEGEVYLWTPAQLKGLLDAEDYKLVGNIWGLEVSAEYAEGYLPLNHRQPTAGEQLRLKQIYQKLLQVRKLRIAPLDTKILTGLNGLALVAFSEASKFAPRYKETAESLRGLIINQMWQEDGLLKGLSNQQSLGTADLEGYAYAAYGLMRYAQIGNKSSDIEISRKIIMQAWSRFFTERGFSYEAPSDTARLFYQPVIDDSPIPSPSAILMDASLMSGEQSLRNKVMTALSYGGELQNRDLFWNATQMMVLSKLFERQIQ